MLLTVIAVATLLVAVVGATFAYFSISTAGSTTATTVTGTTGKIGLMTLSGGETALDLKLSATDMSQEASKNAAVNYFAIKSGTEGDKKTLSSFDKSNFPLESETDVYTKISGIQLSGADADTKYHCQGKFTITVEMKKSDDTALDSSNQDKTKVQSGDGKLYLKTKSNSSSNVTVSIHDDEAGSPAEESVESIDHELNSLLSASKDFWITYDFTATGSDISGEVNAAFGITNKNGDEQNYLADKKITITITPDSGNDKMTCDIVKES